MITMTMAGGQREHMALITMTITMVLKINPSRFLYNYSVSGTRLSSAPQSLVIVLQTQCQSHSDAHRQFGHRDVNLSKVTQPGSAVAT